MREIKCMPRLMVIGATWEQVPLIRTAKEMGCHVLATAPSEDAAGLVLADEQAVVEPRDLRRVLSIAKAYGPDGITADECDYSHFAAVYVSTCLKLPNDGLNSAQFTTNKLWMRQRCHDAHILQPRFFACHSIQDARSAVELIGWPVIVKPVDNRGAFGINVANTHDELELAYLDALMNAHSREVIVEAYIEGTHITVDGCVDQKGHHHNLAIASKKVMPGDKPIIVQVDYPANITDEHRDHTLSINTQVVDVLDIQAGLTHSEYILDEKGRCFLVETANRGGGVLTSAQIVPAMSGVDLSRLLISNALEYSLPVEPVPYSGRVILKFFVFESGRVRAIHGLEDALEFEGVEHIRLQFSPGDELTSPKSGAERHGFVILKAEDDECIDALYFKVLGAIEVIYE